MLLWLFEDCWELSNSQVILAVPETYNTANTDMWNDALYLLKEKLTNVKFLYFLFYSSLTVQQTATCRGSSALLKFQSSYFSAQVCRVLLY
jgi:hypothetical protein